MSDTTGAAEGRLRAEAPTLEEVCRKLEARPEGADALLLDFTRLFLSRAPEELLRARTPDELAAMAASTFAFVASTRGSMVDVAVENPDESWGSDVTVLRTNVSERPFIIDIATNV